MHQNNLGGLATREVAGDFQSLRGTIVEIDGGKALWECFGGLHGGLAVGGCRVEAGRSEPRPYK